MPPFPALRIMEGPMYTTSDHKVLMPLIKKANYYALPLLGADETFHPEWVVDDLEEPNGMFFSPHYFSFLYSEDVNYLKNITRDRFIDGFYGFSGTHPKVFEYMKTHCFIDWLTVSSQYHYTGSNVAVEGDYVIEPLRLEWADEVNEHYEYKSDNTIYEIKRAIEERPTACIRVNGILATWVLLHDDFSIGFMFTKPEFRKKSLGKLVSKAIVEACIEKGITPFLQIVHGNHKSEGLAAKSGFTKHADVYWFGIVAPGVESCENLRGKYLNHYQPQQPVQYVSSYGMSQLQDQTSVYGVQYVEKTIQVYKEGTLQCEISFVSDGEVMSLFNEQDYIDWIELLKAIRNSLENHYMAVLFSSAQTLEGIQSIQMDNNSWSQKL